MQKNGQQILLVGAGPMAIEYAKALKRLNRQFLVAGRSQKSAKEFEEATRVKVITGGIDILLNRKKINSKTAIVAVSEEQLGRVTRKLIQSGVKSILVEKPGGLDFQDVKAVDRLSKKLKAKVYVGYNRRFCASVKKVLEIIKGDGGVKSLFFDFTEASFKITPLIKAPGVKENWFLQNSTHVIDLAFFLAGTPKKLSAFVGGRLPWHKKGAYFSGAGITQRGAFFSYHANWEGPGRWGVEIITRKHKLFLRPLEKLQIQNIGSFVIEDVAIDDDIDVQVKPGIYKQVESFLSDKQSFSSSKKDLCTIDEQIENLKYYQKILEGGKI